MSKRVAEIVVDTLQQAGVRRCYGIVGDTLNHVTDALHRSEIEWVHVRHEEVAAFAAGADSLVSGELTACAGSCGPGGLHFINGIFESNRNRAPMVLIASQVVTSELGMEFPQEVDFKAVYGSCTVFCEQVHSPAQARRVVALACQAAISRRGVAVVILPADISQAEVKHDVPFSVHYAQPVLRPSDGELQRIAGLLGQGKRIGIYAGAGCQGAHAQLLELARRLQAPIAHTSRAKDFVEPDNPYNMGMTGIFGIESGFHTLMECDTLLLLGADFAWGQFYPDKATIIQVDRDGSHLGRRHPVNLGVVGDIAPTLDALLPMLPPREDSTFLDECIERRDKALAKREQEEQPGEGELIHPQHLTALLSKYASDDALFTADGGSPMVWVLRHIRVNGRRRTLTSLLHGTMANAMPQALGLQKAFPGRQVISLSGDGGLAMLLGDLLTAVQEKLPIKVVVFNNGSLNFVELEQKVEGLLDNYTDLKNPDFGRLAEVIGFHGRTVTRSEDLEEAVQDFLAQRGPALLDVHTSRAELVMPPQIEAKQVAGTALYAAKAVLNGRFDDVKHLLVDNFLKK
ncbi:TPA: ubiquinone-dependent pyruvate dehydrogenase [Stenotrophomonas maltophilia]|uniref:thiamine pyrophosphate-dependent enzyme n=1 Tax=Stenotrophomonas TaxID=40323 RepID=UPI001009BB85|nr:MULTISPECIES: thiamine pyrophosphate-dependent enzyme [Stenotrophomonas]MBH1593259.1 ubiquinone-dependent pyruvate dehydrogenase [Stenotrophomonas maltophilia]MDH2023543.1 thiamine pyrophosphate-binding protein [Stenotrophomonas sp. GD03680]MDI9249411.1 thiamine pyrophosphate-binding protein [Stenotrophomonas sp. RS-48]RXK67727.1 ubiquinone-dependent pyruvate dehydrogenase [Stenotrophomonas sp. MA5]HEL3750252.1 ubiquinone-dependent pyruvate dehydrogenase [Stenotrophomonas maltophilia]